MGTIYSSTGLVSGIDYGSLIESLMKIEAQPRDQLLRRVDEIEAQRTAYSAISAYVSAMLSYVKTLGNSSAFLATSSTSSNDSVLGVSTSSDAAPGSYKFVVRALASTHQVVSRGFSSPDALLSAGEVLIESADAKVNAATRLEELNGYSGVQRGSFELIDGEGNEATISLGDATTLADVVEKINDAGIGVSAEVRGDGLVLTETNGGTLRIREVDGGHVASDLGFGLGNTYDSGGQLTGSSLMTLSNSTPLDALNDGIGLRTVRAGGDFTVNGMTVDMSTILKDTVRIDRLNHGNGLDLGTIKITTEDDNGVEHESEVDLSGVETIGQLKDAIEGSVEGLTVTLSDNGMRIGYSDSDNDKTLKIEDLTGNTAHDLGLEGESSTGKISGDGVLFMDTMADVLAAINYASDNDGSITASLDGTRISIDAGDTLELATLNDSNALRDLGFTEGTYEGMQSGSRIIGGIDSALLSSLNGGQGFEPGRVNISVGDSNVVVDLSGTETLQEVIERLEEVSEAEDLGLEIGYDHTGTRLVINSIDGVTPIQISDVAGSGNFAEAIGLAQEEPAVEIRSDNLQLQYITEATALEDLNNGAGVSLGTIKLTNAQGLFTEIDLSDAETMQDVIKKINNAKTVAGDELNISARINDTGDGIVLEDNSGGDGKMSVSDVSGSAANDLNILGESENGILDGSFEISITLTGSETLDDLATKINETGNLASASIFNGGGGMMPYRLQITSSMTGSAGELIVDGLDFSTLTQAQDAQVLLGDGSSGVLLTSSSNTLEDVVPGVTIDLNSVSDDPVTVTVSRDTSGVVEAASGLVETFNAVMGMIDEYASYDTETEERGILLGESTVRSIDRRLSSLFISAMPTKVGDIRRLADLGISYSSGKLEFDQEEFAAALQADPELLAEFFSDEENGAAAYIEEAINAIVDEDGLINRRDGTLERQQEDLNDRVETLNGRLERKEERMLAEFTALETALAAMQTQQTALQTLSNLAASSKQ